MHEPDRPVAISTNKKEKVQLFRTLVLPVTHSPIVLLFFICSFRRFWRIYFPITILVNKKGQPSGS
jgi:hypothetical protein